MSIYTLTLCDVAGLKVFSVTVTGAMSLSSLCFNLKVAVSMPMLRVSKSGLHLKVAWSWFDPYGIIAYCVL